MQSSLAWLYYEVSGDLPASTAMSSGIWACAVMTGLFGGSTVSLSLTSLSWQTPSQV